jgi:hypothetical protein
MSREIEEDAREAFEDWDQRFKVAHPNHPGIGTTVAEIFWAKPGKPRYRVLIDGAFPSCETPTA